MRHALARVIDNDGKVITGGQLLASEYDVTPLLGRSDDDAGFVLGSGASFGPRQKSRSSHRRGGIQPQCVGAAGRHATLALRGFERVRFAGIERGAAGVARPGAVPLALSDLRRNLGAAL